MSISPRTEDLRDAGFHFGPTPPVERENGDGLVDERELWLDTSGPVLRWWDGTNWVVPDATSASVLAQATLAPAWSWAVAIEASSSVLSGLEAEATLSPSWSWAVAIEAAASVQEAVDAQATLAPSWSWAVAIEAAAEVLDVVDAQATLAPSWSWAVAIAAAAEVADASTLASEQLDDSPDFLFVSSDVTGTTANDQTANGNDGTLVGGVTAGDGFEFDGDDGYIDSNFQPGETAAVTIEMLIRIQSGDLDSNRRPFGIVGGPNDNYWQSVPTSTRLQWSHRGGLGGDVTISGPTGTDDGNWHHWVCTVDPSGDADMWLDGVKVATASASSLDNFKHGTAVFAIANNYNGGFLTREFLGDQDNIAIYTGTQLSDARIEAHAEAAGFTVP